MTSFPHQPPAQTQVLLSLAPLCAPLGLDPRRIGEARASLLLACHEQERELGQLTENYAQLLSSRPPEREGDDGGALADWEDAVEKAEAQLIECELCFSLPLGHRFGEQAAPPDLFHWLGASAALSVAQEGAHGGH